MIGLLDLSLCVLRLCVIPFFASHPCQHFRRLLAQPPGFGRRRGLGNRANNRLRVAAANQKPSVRPVQPQPVQPVGRRIGKCDSNASRAAGIFSFANEIFVFTIS